MKHILKATLVLVCLLPSAASAQQVISKGSWSEVAPSADGPVTLGVTATAAECVAAIHAGHAAATAQHTVDQAAFDQALTDGDTPRDQNQALSAADQDVDRAELYDTANCVQN